MSLLFVFTIGRSQNIVYQWAKPIGGTATTDQCASIEMQIDKSNNLVFAGYFIGNADFDPGIGNTNSSSPSNNDIFISKYDSAGNFMWVKQIGNSLDNEPQSITLDSNNNIYIIGSYNDTLDFDPGPGITSLNSGNTNAYILKLDSNGNFLWVKELTCNWLTQLRKIIIDQTGNLYLTGKYSGTTDFDPGLNNYSLSSIGGSWNEFILKLDSLGNFSWVRTISNSNVAFNDMALDIGDNCYVTGIFTGIVDFDPGPGTFQLSSLFWGKSVVLKLDANGVFKWAKSFQSSPTDTFQQAFNLAIDKFDIYVLQMIPATISVPIYNYYLTRIDSGGNLIWRQYMFKDIANPNMIVDTAHNVYISGDFGYMDGSGLFSLDPIYGRNFITKANSSGTFIWVKQFGCMSSTAIASCWSTVSDIKMNQFNEIFTTGFYRDSSDFNPNGSIINPLYATTSKTMFIQKLSNCENLSSSISDTACKNFNWHGLIYSTNGNYTQTFVNNRGCDSSVTLHLFLNGKNAQAAIIFDTLLQALTGGTAGISFQWLNCDSGYAIIPGATNSSFSPNTNGHYAVVFQFNGCIDTSDNCYTISALQTNDILLEDIYIGPNPTSDKIFIRFKRFSLNPYTIEIYNMLGEKILVTTQHEIDVSKLPKGIYYLKLMNFIKKIVIN